jgi:hypothetical protein
MVGLAGPHQAGHQSGTWSLTGTYCVHSYVLGETQPKLITKTMFFKAVFYFLQYMCRKGKGTVTVKVYIVSCLKGLCHENRVSTATIGV